MIKCNLAVLLAERGLKMSDVINETKLAKNTVRSLYYNEAKGIQFETLTTICDFLDVDVGELLTKIDIKIDFTTLKEVSENTYSVVINVISGYKKISGEAHLIFESEKTKSVELIIPLNIYHVLSSVKHIQIDFMKNEVIIPLIKKLNMTADFQEYIVSVESGNEKESDKWLTNTNFLIRRPFLSEEPF